MKRTALVTTLLMSFAPLGLMLTATETAQAAASPGGLLARFGISTSAAAVTSSGSVDAGGGLVLTDQGGATVTGSLDSSPSSAASSVAVEPGTTVRTLINSGTLTPPSPLPAPPIPAIPGSAAAYPGGPATASDSTVGSSSAAADPTTATASVSAASTPAAAGATAASASESLVSNADGTLLSGSVTTDSGTIGVGPLTIAGVVGTAAVGYDAAGNHATAGTTVTGATIAGTPVTIDDTGIHLAGQSSGPLPTPTLNSLLAMLTQAGITITVLTPVATKTATQAFGDSGGVVVHEITADATSGATTVSSATDITLFLGHATATLLDAAAVPFVDVPVPAETASPEPSTTEAPVTPDQPSAPAAAAVVPGTSSSGTPPRVVAGTKGTAGTKPQLRVLGQLVDGPTALGAFAVWEFLTLGIVTLATMVARSRTPEEPHLCPCP